jgi:adenine-specific DNA-methyltransferase
MAAAVLALQEGGELVTLSPRSFTNGPYFKPFRHFFLERMALHQIHLFEARDKAFEDEAVLQENIILHSVKTKAKPENVLLTSSLDAQDEMFSQRHLNYQQVVKPHDQEAFIHLVSDEGGQQVQELIACFKTSLDELGLQVSTGRVVDFRAEAFLREQPSPAPEPDLEGNEVSEEKSVPLIYPGHLSNGVVNWPRYPFRKPNAIVSCQATASLLVPNANYVLVKRFSAKEEKKRVVAVVYEGASFNYPQVGFENHLNYYHMSGKGLDHLVAYGLAAYLNSTLVDEYLRQFNGHTQVNATDLRKLKYPDLTQLKELGTKVASASQFPNQKMIDTLVGELLEKERSAMSSDPVQLKQRLEEAKAILKELGFPSQQRNERSALTLLALAGLTPTTEWSGASQPLMGITPIMEFMRQHYGKEYAPNTRKTIRRQTVHQFLEAGLVISNPDQPNRPINSGKTVYQLEASAYQLLKTYASPEWTTNLKAYLASRETLAQHYLQERQLQRIPLSLSNGQTVSLSPGGQNQLIEKVIHEFAPNFTPGGEVLYIGDTDEKYAYFDQDRFNELGIKLDPHGKMPDVVIYYPARKWLVLIEAVTSHGPVDAKRKAELEQLFRNPIAGLVFVTTFLSFKALNEYLARIAWETEVWVAEAPSHLIHFNGERFLGPY